MDERSTQCGFCGDPVAAKRGGARGRPPKFCSVECKEAARNAALRAATAAKKAGRICACCQGPVPLAVSSKARCCSPACSIKWQNKKKADAVRRANLASRQPCGSCGAQIPASARSHAKYCSRSCMAAASARRWRQSGAAAAYLRYRNYGVTPAEFAALWEAQDAKCAICRAASAGGKGGFHLDHCHDTGRVRGLLCHRCNLGLGNFRDDPDRLRAAIDYLERAARR